MTSASRLERIRQIIEQKLHAHGARSDATLLETLLIRKGSYCGHRINIDGFYAVWFIEEQELKLYSSDGNLLESLNAAAELQSADHDQRQAA